MLGAMRLRWCPACDIPVIKLRECPLCASRTRPVKHTPPGDVAPASLWHTRKLDDLLIQQYGVSSSQIGLDTGVLLVNPCPHVDRLDEIIGRGSVLASMEHTSGGWVLKPRPHLASAVACWASKGIVEADPGAAEGVLSGANLMAPGVVDAQNVRKGDQVIVKSGDHIIAVGTARMDGKDMPGSRGMAVKVRWYERMKIIRDIRSSGTLDMALQANRKYIREISERAVRFIRETLSRHDLPAVVSVSGGKDSLVTAHLVKRAGTDFACVFADTGLEFPETVEHVRQVCSELGVPLHTEHAGDAFWRGLEVFGPPARNYRWCCKVAKLGPLARLLKRQYPGGVLTFVAQRRYESYQRMGKGAVWENPWIRGQLAASPVQNWSALEIWFYILIHGLRPNIWYSRGLHRVGCFLCPSSDAGDLEIVREHFPGYARWLRYLESYAREMGYPSEWVHGAGWCVKAKKEQRSNPRIEYRPELLENAFRVAGEVRVDEDGIWAGDTGIRSDGTPLNKLGEKLALRGMYCLGCGVCASQCPHDAITLEDGRFRVDPERCVHCLECVEYCPVSFFM